MTDEKMVKTLYAAIIKQALDDWLNAQKRDDRAMKRDIKRFFNSDWAKRILDVLELDYRIINAKFHITTSRAAK